MKKRTAAGTVVYAAILGALSLIFLYLGNLLPTGRWGIAALAGLMPAGAIISAGMTSGVICWLGVSILGFFLVPDKLVVMLFALLFGLYPIVKNLIEGMRKLVPEYILKILFFNLSFTVIFLAMKTAVLDSLPVALSVVWLLYLVGNGVFLLYDYGFSKLIALYMSRIYRPSR